MARRARTEKIAPPTSARTIPTRTLPTAVNRTERGIESPSSAGIFHGPIAGVLLPIRGGLSDELSLLIARIVTAIWSDSLLLLPGLLPRKPARLLQRLPQKELDLRIDAAHLSPGPAMKSVIHSRLQTERECFPFGHPPFLLLVQCACIDHWFYPALAAQDHEKVAHHGGFTFLV